MSDLGSEDLEDQGPNLGVRCFCALGEKSLACLQLLLHELFQDSLIWSSVQSAIVHFVTVSLGGILMPWLIF